MIATKKIMWSAAPIMIVEGGTLYDSKKREAIKGDLFLYKDMVIFCSYGEAAEQRPMHPGEHCFIYASGYSECFARNGVFVLEQSQNTTNFSGGAQLKLGLQKNCEQASVVEVAG